MYGIDHNQMQVVLITRGLFTERSLETIVANYRSFLAAGGNSIHKSAFCAASSLSGTTSEPAAY